MNEARILQMLYLEFKYNMLMTQMIRLYGFALVFAGGSAQQLYGQPLFVRIGYIL
jgi:hypothetical protein